jgi:Ca2+-binding RTX toxin-like protein
MAILNAQQAVNTRDLPELEPITGDTYDIGTGQGAYEHGPSGIKYRFGDDDINMPGTYVFAAAMVISGPIESITVKKSGNAAYDITEFDLNIEELWADASNNGKLDTVPAEIFKGDDTLNGSAFDDILFAFAGSDVVEGGNGDDEMDGGSGDDVMNGGDGNDEMNGGDGADDMTGGLGADTQTGGGGGDTLFYSSILESTKKASGRDTIVGFDRTEGDLIDLTAIDAKKGKGNQDFKFIKKQDFHDKKGELRYKVKNGDAYVEGDTDGNGKADFVIVVADVTKLTGGDFEL